MWEIFTWGQRCFLGYDLRHLKWMPRGAFYKKVYPVLLGPQKGPRAQSSIKSLNSATEYRRCSLSLSRNAFNQTCLLFLGYHTASRGTILMKRMLMYFDGFHSLIQVEIKQRSSLLQHFSWEWLAMPRPDRLSTESPMYHWVLHGIWDPWRSLLTLVTEIVGVMKSAWPLST